MKQAETTQIIALAHRRGVVLTTEDFRRNSAGDLTIDGMDPREWLDVMTMD